MSNNAMSNETGLDWLARNVHEWPEGKCEVMVHWPRNVDALIWSRISSNAGWVTKEQWLARRAELQNKPSWGGHEFAVIAQGGNGYWYGSNVSEEKFGHEELFCITGTGWNYICDGIVLGDWRDTLEKRPDMYKKKKEIDTSSECVHKTEESVHISELEMLAKVSHLISDKRHRITPSEYTKTIHGVSVDVYDVLQAWGVSNPALQHLIKKALQCGQRGHKDNAQDLQDIIDSAIRAKELG